MKPTSSVMNVTIRAATIEDSSTIDSLITQLGYPTTQGEMQQRLKALFIHPDYHTFVAESRSVVLGVIGVCINLAYEYTERYGRILVLAVDEQARGHGIGSALVAHAEDWFRNQRVDVGTVNSGQQRQDAHRFYERLGYQGTGVKFIKSLE